MKLFRVRAMYLIDGELVHLEESAVDKVYVPLLKESTAWSL